MEYAIIGTLLIFNAIILVVLSGVYWRKQVWKRRATLKSPTFWQVIKAAADPATAQMSRESLSQMFAARNDDEWSAVIDD